MPTGDVTGRPFADGFRPASNSPNRTSASDSNIEIAGQPREPAGGLQRDAALAIHRRGERQHVQVVRRIGQEALTLRRLLIGLPGLQARLHGVAPSPDPGPDVRGHVIDVARARDGIAEMLGTRSGAAGSGVNSVMWM